MNLDCPIKPNRKVDVIIFHGRCTPRTRGRGTEWNGTRRAMENGQSDQVVHLFRRLSVSNCRSLLRVHACGATRKVSRIVKRINGGLIIPWSARIDTPNELRRGSKRISRALCAGRREGKKDQKTIAVFPRDGRRTVIPADDFLRFPPATGRGRGTTPRSRIMTPMISTVNSP